MQYEYQVIDYSEPYEVEEPHAIFRYVSERAAPEEENTLFRHPIVTVDDYIEDPDVLDFFIVLAEIGKNEWVCYFKDRFAICKKLDAVGYKGSSFFDGGYFYYPYVPLMITPTVLDPKTLNKTKGIVTRYGKKLLE
jgi:hypothetical protein